MNYKEFCQLGIGDEVKQISTGKIGAVAWVRMREDLENSEVGVRGCISIRPEDYISFKAIQEKKKQALETRLAIKVKAIRG